MRVCGIIAEYDPFHRGHLHHLEMARRQSQADYVICVISCAFTQRGMPGLFSTQDRARMALMCGADLVLGMPLSYGCAQANRFALGGVGILNALQVVDCLSFGVEQAALPWLPAAFSRLDEADESFLLRQRAALEAGRSLARARGEALAGGGEGLPGEVLRSPNFVLALCYLAAIKRLGSAMRPLPIPRGGDYHASDICPWPSATAVRAALLKGDLAGVQGAVPQAVCPLMLARWQAGGLHLPEALDKPLLARLLAGGDFSGIAEVSEGLDQLILRQAKQAASREELTGLVKTKRYTRSRISRALTGMLLGLERAADEPPRYARLLGFRREAAPLLQAIKRSAFQLVDRPAKSALPGIRQDMHAEMLWRLGAGQAAAMAYQQDMIII
ncbi:MAG: nucleotidyltransferase family protein [Christensenellales bacterium]